MRGLIFEELGSNFIPDGRGAGDAGGNIGHRRVIVVADPGGDEIVLGVADGPVVALVIGGAGFNSYLMVGDVEEGSGAKGRDAGNSVREDVGKEIGDIRVEDRVGLTGNMLGGGFGWLRKSNFRNVLAREIHQGFILAVGDFKNRMEVDFEALVGQSTENNSHVDHFDISAA